MSIIVRVTAGDAISESTIAEETIVGWSTVFGPGSVKFVRSILGDRFGPLE
jgi:hypothetical protein